MATQFNLKKSGIQLIIGLVIVGALNPIAGYYFTAKVAELEAESKRLTHATDAAHSLQFNVSQIQQFLTDVSATSDQDGFKDAEENFGAANLQLDELTKLQPESKAKFDATREQLAVFYSTGKEMANTYLSQGQKAGNDSMKRPQTGFDSRAETLIDGMKSFITPLEINNTQVGNDLDERISELRSTITIINIVSITAFALLLFRLGRSLTRFLGGEPTDLHAASSRIAEGRFDFHMPVSSDDKFSVMAQMDTMRNQLKARIEAESKLSAENLRVKIALDNVSTNVMIANTDRNIIYMNKSIEKMLKNAEADIRQVLPQFNASNLMGANIDQFHKNPGHQKEMLASFNTNHKTKITVGPRTFALSANPVLNDQGERLGSVVEWNDMTNEVAVEKEVDRIVRSASSGDLSQRINTAGMDGFFLSLSNDVNKLVVTVNNIISDTVHALTALSQGDLTQHITSHYEGDFEIIKNNINQTSDRLKQIIGSIKEATDLISTASGEISLGNGDLSKRTEEQASSLEETSSTMEQLSSTVRQNAENAKQANQLASAASSVAIRGGEAVGEVVHTMGAISESSRKIEDIISVIDGIAFQTNILALNAAVEAARAGEQGRGFAVVASEVRNLAQRSASAAKEIKELISDSVAKVQDGTKQVEAAGKTMEEIVSSVKQVTDIIAEIAAASAEQSTGIDQVNQTITHIDEVTQQNSALVEETAAAAESLADQAVELAHEVSLFKLDQLSNEPKRIAALPAPV
ncbi:MAG: methyl-accepting chemotaxis protein [Gallionellaceae bacterium]